MMTKEQIRNWTQKRWTDKKVPLPSRDEMRRQLGFPLVNGKTDCPR